jgi:hypothetical protein
MLSAGSSGQYQHVNADVARPPLGGLAVSGGMLGFSPGSRVGLGVA